MLFDPRPKTSRRDLFNREEELALLDNAARRGEPLILVLGIRRVGKTSLLRSFLEEWRGIHIDMRGVKNLAELYNRIGEGLSTHIDKFMNIIKNIRGIRVHGAEVEIRWHGRDSISLVGLLEELNRRGGRTILIFDEAQLIRPPISTEIKRAIAYAYDNLENITVILSGSEVGLLRDFIGVDNPESPLYGRYAVELVVDRFSPTLSREFLETGFREQGVSPDRDLIEKAVEIFDGIVGWLVYFGKSYIDGLRDLNHILDIAIRLATREIEKLSTREKLVLKAIAEGANTWSSVRRYLEEKEGVTVPKSTLTRIIKKLEKLSLIQDYKFLDPIYSQAAKRLKTRSI
ncbi:MAG: ATP-binding protein [Desulfurococcales archaeon]|nr:ATP-binding protein [Desulfurococcales archaeon]